MALNYIILGLIFFAGSFLVLAALFNARFMFGQSTDTPNENMRSRGLMPFFSGIFKGISRIPLFADRKRSAYFFIGIVILILGVVAIFTGFLEEKIEI